jgi:hypothetical protein
MLRKRAINIICVRAGPNRHGDPTMRMFEAVISNLLVLAAPALVLGVITTL